MRAGRTFPRWLPLCAAVLVLFQLGGLLHLAVAPHGVCWEHGVVVDLEASASAGNPAARPEGMATAPVRVVRSDQHPHCPALWVLRHARLEGARSTAALGVAPRLPAVTATPRVPWPDGWALRRAPKQSPPV